MKRIRITEEVAIVKEISYDVLVPDHASMDNVEDWREDWVEVHDETLRKNVEIVHVEAM